MLKMAGTGAGDITSRSIFRGTRARLPWLLASFAGGLLAVYVLGIFESQLQANYKRSLLWRRLFRSLFGVLLSEKLTSRTHGGCCGVNSAGVLCLGVSQVFFRIFRSMHGNYRWSLRLLMMSLVFSLIFPWRKCCCFNDSQS